MPTRINDQASSHCQSAGLSTSVEATTGRLHLEVNGTASTREKTGHVGIQHADIELLIKILTLPVAIRTSLEGVIDAFLEHEKK